MTEFYTWTPVGRSSVTLLLAFCVMAQTLAAVLSFYRQPRGIRRLIENVTESSVLFHIIVLSLLMGQGQLSHSIGLIVPTGYLALRYAAAIVAVLLTCMVIAFSKRGRHLLSIVASCLTLPLIETVCGNAYAWVYIIALLFWLLRSIHICISQYRKINMSISALSVKNAVDSLHTGVLFSEPDGFIVLVNAQMQRLMTAITGKIYRNSRYFYEFLVSGDLMPGCRKTEYEGQIVCLLPDEKAWVFTSTEIQIGKKRYIQLTAADISRRWALTAELQRQENLLIFSGEELRAMIMGLQSLSRTRELQNAKLRAHDILGQRLTMLLHTVNTGQALDYDLLRKQLQNLLSDLKSGQSAASPRDKLENFSRTFQTIGVEIHLDGDLPGDDMKGYMVVDIISESVINAVRHGFASKIFVQIDHFEGAWQLEITDNGNGHSPLLPIREGGGIGGMRGKVEAHGGSLVVTNQPHFILRVVLPGGETVV